MESVVKKEDRHSRLDPELMPRRDVLGLASLWAAACVVLFSAIGMLRLPKAAVLASPSKKFRVALPDNLASGEVFIPTGRTTGIVKDADGVFAVSLICTHLGCIVKPVPTGFECPCHGSRFDRQGSVTKGPAPQPLPWLKVSGGGNQIVVDEGAAVPGGSRISI